MKALPLSFGPVLLGVILAACVLVASALADTCPNCGGDLTDTGRCPYCQPKPNEGTGQ